MLGVDSWWQPNAGQIEAAKASGVQAWSGYFSNGHDGIYGGGWSDATFRLVKSCGLQTLAFVSYRADAATWKARAAALGIQLCLDVERSVDGGDSSAVDPWLAASGARLYGSGPRSGAGSVMTTHLQHGHSGYMVSDYEPRVAGYSVAPWPTNDPKPSNGALAWQYAGSVTHSWGTVDLGYYEDTFFTGFSVDTAQQIQQIWEAIFGPYGAAGIPWNNVEIIRRMLADLGAPYSPSNAVPFVPTAVAPGTGLTAAQSAALAQIPAIATALASGDLTLAHIEAALKAA